MDNLGLTDGKGSHPDCNQEEANVGFVKNYFSSYYHLDDLTFQNDQIRHPKLEFSPNPSQIWPFPNESESVI